MSDPIINKSMTSAEWAMLIALSIVFGGAFFFVGVAVKELPPTTIVFCRVFLGAVALHLFMLFTGRKMVWAGTAWAAFFVMGLLNNVLPFSLIVWGQTHIASGVASIINATTPLFTVMVAHAFTADEKLSPLRIMGIIAGILGVVIMIGGGALAEGWTSALAQIACLIAAASYAVASVFGRRFRQMKIDPFAVATGMVSASAIMMLPLMLVVDEPWTLAMPSGATIGALIGLALLSTFTAYILYFKILDGAGATNLSLVTFLVPVSAIFLGIFILGETLLVKHIIGLALIVLGLALVDGRLFNKKRSR